MRLSYILASTLAVTVTAAPSTTTTASSPTYFCPAPVHVNGSGVGKNVLVCCERLIGIVLRENTGTGTNCALSSGGAGTTGKCEDSTKPRPGCCAVVAGAVPGLPGAEEAGCGVPKQMYK
ncbi:MAG: hypothetical protein L6R37_006453 [Teloschistes peruensis]|nr:MAG: hypothetical protein L6R37_006453 [Teloschistes peruensis]